MDNQVCLRWRDYQSSLTSSLENLWDEESFCDVTLFCGGQEIRAHKLILSACSTLFKSLLKNNICQHPIIILHDVSLSILGAILQFIYKGEVSIEPDQLHNLLRAASLLQIRGLDGIAENEVNLENEDITSYDFNHVKRKKPKCSSSPKKNDNELSLVTPKKESLIEEEINEIAIDNDKVDNPQDSFVVLEREVEEEDNHSVIIDVDPLIVMKPTITVKSSAEIIPHSSREIVCNNVQFLPYPCPFCCRAYASWGYRRRHIKAIHTTSPKLPCKWCSIIMASREDWENHVIDEHHLSRSEAEQGLKVLEEAHMVLQTTNIAENVFKENTAQSLKSKDKKK